MLRPNPAYRANPQRAVYITGRIDQQLLDKVTPQILSLQAASREPITVYIDSPGGYITSAETLSRLLCASDQDYSPSCRLVTVVTGRAASAAADLLSSGHCAMALPGTSILFHGGRRLPDDPITMTAASEIMEALRLTNDRYALTLAERALHRFGFRFVSQRSKFDDFRKTTGKTLSDLGCFLGIIARETSTAADKVVTRALARNSRYGALVQDIAKRLIRRKRFASPKRPAEPEAEIITAIVEYELKANKKNPKWTFSSGGFGQLNIDFLLVREYMSIYDSSHLNRLCELFGDFLLTEQDQAELAGIADAGKRTTTKYDKIKTILRPLWLFFMALCYALQEEENELSATDAYWLGLIDEVIGNSDLQPERLTLEAEPDNSRAQTTLDLSPPKEVAALPAPAAPELASQG